MKFTTHNTAFIDNTGTSLQGSIQATMNDMIKAFGPPELNGDTEDKSQFHWTVKSEDGVIATIYDWKQYRDIDPTENLCWNIGGFKLNAKHIVHQAYRTAHSLMPKAA